MPSFGEPLLSDRGVSPKNQQSPHPKRDLVRDTLSNMPAALGSPPEGCEHYDDAGDVPQEIVK